MTTLRGQRVVVRPLTDADLPALVAYRNDPRVARYQAWELPYPLDRARGLVTDDPLGSRGWVQRAIAAPDGTLLGDLGLRTVGEQAEVGITLAPDAQGHGHASEALQLVVDHAFAGLGLHRLLAETDRRNAPVDRLLRRAGFRLEGTRLQAYPHRGEWTDSNDYGLLRSEWARAGAAARGGPVLLVGGGRDRASLVAAHAGLAEALTGGRLLCVVADEGGERTEPDRWRSMLTDAGVGSVVVHRAAAGTRLTPGDLDGFDGLYVAGGLTPLYADLLAPLANAMPDGLVYAGFSAGAAVAAATAIVGGWRHGGRAVAPEEASEALDELTVVPGLGLVPFAVEAHATQWGTLARAVHAVGSGLVGECWALDEGTGLLVAGGRARDVRGAGQAYHVVPDADGVRLRVVRPGDVP